MRPRSRPTQSRARLNERTGAETQLRLRGLRAQRSKDRHISPQFSRSDDAPVEHARRPLHWQAQRRAPGTVSDKTRMATDLHDIEQRYQHHLRAPALGGKRRIDEGLDDRPELRHQHPHDEQHHGADRRSLERYNVPHAGSQRLSQSRCQYVRERHKRRALELRSRRPKVASRSVWGWHESTQGFMRVRSRSRKPYWCTSAAAACNAATTTVVLAAIPCQAWMARRVAGLCVPNCGTDHVPKRVAPL